MKRNSHFLLRIALSFLLFINSIVTVAQEVIISGYDTIITSKIISDHIHILASDSMEGRETARLGMRKAAEYVSTQFKTYGLTPAYNNTYFQEVPFRNLTSSTIRISTENYTLEPSTDFYITSAPPEINFTSDSIYFAGFGIIDSASGRNDYKKANISGKIVLISDGEPVNKKGKSLVTGKQESSTWVTDSKRKIQIAKDNGAAVIFFVSNDFGKGAERMKRWMTQERLSLDKKASSMEPPVIFINEAMGDRFLKNAGKSIRKLNGKQEAGFFSTRTQLKISPNKLTCTNVIGYVEGSDLKEEVVVISGHLDHLGMRGEKIYNGADDNGSGCAAILNMAAAFAKAKKDGNGPRRSILFIAFTGEEKGLLGSQYYVENPIFALDQTIANLNIDMIGRSDTIQRETTNYTYIIGSNKLSTELHRIHEATNTSCCNLTLDYKYNDPADKSRLYYRSDHYNFVKNGVPAIFYFTGFHEDYHQPTDTVDKIDIKKTTSIAKLIFNTAWELANRTERIKVDAEAIETGK